VAIELAVGVQSLTLPAPEASRAPDRLDPVHRTAGFGDRRKAQNRPGLLRQDVKVRNDAERGRVGGFSPPR